MKKVTRILSYLALAGIVLPPFLYFGGSITLSVTQTVMLVATILWFASAPLWMEHHA